MSKNDCNFYNSSESYEGKGWLNRNGFSESNYNLKMLEENIAPIIKELVYEQEDVNGKNLSWLQLNTCYYFLIGNSNFIPPNEKYKDLEMDSELKLKLSNELEEELENYRLGKFNQLLNLFNELELSESRK